MTGVRLIVSACAISIWDVLPKGPCQVPVGDLKFGKRWSSVSKWETSRWVAIHYLAPGLLQQAGYESGDQNEDKTEAYPETGRLDNEPAL